MASAQEVQSLKREVEMLKLMLEQERVRGGGGGGPSSSAGELSARSLGTARLPSPTKPQQQQHQQREQFFSRSFDDDIRREPTPRRPVTAATSPSRGKTLRWKDASTPSQLPPHQKTTVASTTYTQFVPIDTKRGKWWLKDRQILSRNVPAPNDHSVAMKVRETWLWSGRRVIVDKIVTGPRPRDDEYEDHYGEREPSNDHRVRDLQDEAARYREELRRIGSARSIPTSPSGALSSTTEAAQAAFHDSKQLAKELLQPKSESNATVEEVSSATCTAMQRMEVQMAQALAATSETHPAMDAAQPSDGLTARGDAEPSSPLLPQLSPPKSPTDSSLPAL